MNESTLTVLASTSLLCEFYLSAGTHFVMLKFSNFRLLSMIRYHLAKMDSFYVPILTTLMNSGSVYSKKLILR